MFIMHGTTMIFLFVTVGAFIIVFGAFGWALEASIAVDDDGHDESGGDGQVVGIADVAAVSPATPA